MPTQILPPVAVRRAATVALVVAFVHIVFGAIVRISGSGMGCGDNWPKCYGYWFPPFERMDLIIEVMHRYLAFALFVAIAWLVTVSWRVRAERSVAVYACPAHLHANLQKRQTLRTKRVASQARFRAWHVAKK